MSLDIYTNSDGKLVIKGDAKLSEEELELLIASLICELSDRLPLDKEDMEQLRLDIE